MWEKIELLSAQSSAQTRAAFKWSRIYKHSVCVKKRKDANVKLDLFVTLNANKLG